MKKNLCLLIYDLRSGGAERVISKWSALLCDEFNVYLTVFHDADNVQYERGGQHVCLDVPSDNRNIFTKIKTVLRRAVKLKKFVKQNGIDIVISFCNECNLVNTISAHRARKVCSVRSAADLDANVFVRFVMLHPKNTVIVQTESLKETLRERYGTGVGERVLVLGNPFDREAILKCAKDAPPLHVEEILRAYKTIINVASFKESKNHVNLLKSFELLCRETDDAYLILVGADNGLEAAVRKMILGSSFQDRIIILGEIKNPFAVVSRATVFCLPSYAEGLPNALAEAMICGTPVVAVNCPTGPYDLLVDGGKEVSYNEFDFFEADYGVLVRPFSRNSSYNYGDITVENEHLAYVLRKILQDGDFYTRLKQKAETGSLRFDLERYKRELISLVNGILEMKKI